MAGLLAEVEALEYDRHVREEVVDRERAAVEEEGDDGLAERGQGFDQLILTADEVEAGAVAHVLQVPGFARGLLVAAERKNDDVGLLRDFDSFFDLTAIFCRIGRDYGVLIPVAADGDFATFAVEDLRAIADPVPDAFEDRDFVFGNSAVSAEKGAVGVGTDHGDGFDLVQVERGDVVVVLEEGNGFLRGGAGELLVRIGADDAIGLGGIDVTDRRRGPFRISRRAWARRVPPAATL